MSNYTANKILLFIVALIFAFAVLSSIGNAQNKAKAAAKTPKQIAVLLLKAANQVSDSQLSTSDRDKLAEQIEALSAYVQKEYNTGALCYTNAECEKLAK